MGGVWRVGGRETQEGRDVGIYVYVYVIHFVIKQKQEKKKKNIVPEITIQDTTILPIYRNITLIASNIKFT